MRIVVTGAAGLLGTDMMQVLSESHAVHSLDAFGPGPRVDVADHGGVRAALRQAQPDAVIHCAGYTDVDGCERDPDRAYRSNALGAGAVAAACHEVGAAMVYVGTDFVFDGEKQAPYTEFDVPRPLNVYGASKLAGEQLVRSLCPRYCIVRTQWLYGAHGRCFPRAILERAASGSSLRVVADQVGSPTYTRDVARVVGALIERPVWGIVHVANRGEVSWHQFAVRLLDMCGMASPVEAITAAQWGSDARRPPYSVLRPYVLELLGMAGMLRPWEEALAEYLSETGHRSEP